MMLDQTQTLSTNSLETSLERLYQHRLFQLLKIDPQTGKIGLDEGQGLKFPTFPYIGSRYGDRPRILFIGLDIGGDEKPGGIQSIEERRAAIETKSPEGHNPHIAGTYFTAMYLLRDRLSLMRSHWNCIDDGKTCQALLKLASALPDKNPLSYVALTNYYKFVSIGRKGRAGARNRRYLSAQTKGLEQCFLLNEVRTFNPEVIVFQSLSFQQTQYQPILREISEHRVVYVAPHPSARHKDARVPSAMALRLKEGRRADYSNDQE